MTIRLGVVRDFRAEGWPSMDLVADQLLAFLPLATPSVIPFEIAPHYRRLFSLIPFAGRFGYNADRLLNRHVLLPRDVRRVAHRFDFLHVVDHSYAHLVSTVPPGHAGVYCHDLDAFRCLLEPGKEPRPWWFRKLAQTKLDGLKRAAVVFHNSLDVGRQLREHGLVVPTRLVHAPLGVAAEFTPETAQSVEVPVRIESPFLLHVGSNIPRKRLDVLLDVFAAVQGRVPGLRLIQVGGPWPPRLAEQITRLGIGPAVTQVRGLTREQLAELYRRAAVVLITSEAEGFGLPVIEALACGVPVVASDLAVLREVGGDQVYYCTLHDVLGWVKKIAQILEERPSRAAREARLEHAARFSWREHARIIGEAYQRLAQD